MRLPQSPPSVMMGIIINYVDADPLTYKKWSCKTNNLYTLFGSESHAESQHTQIILPNLLPHFLLSNLAQFIFIHFVQKSSWETRCTFSRLDKNIYPFIILFVTVYKIRPKQKLYFTWGQQTTSVISLMLGWGGGQKHKNSRKNNKLIRVVCSSRRKVLMNAA